MKTAFKFNNPKPKFKQWDCIAHKWVWFFLPKHQSFHNCLFWGIIGEQIPRNRWGETRLFVCNVPIDVNYWQISKRYAGRYKKLAKDAILARIQLVTSRLKRWWNPTMSKPYCLSVVLVTHYRMDKVIGQYTAVFPKDYFPHTLFDKENGPADDLKGILLAYNADYDIQKDRFEHSIVALNNAVDIEV